MVGQGYLEYQKALAKQRQGLRNDIKKDEDNIRPNSDERSDYYSSRSDVKAAEPWFVLGDVGPAYGWARVPAIAGAVCKVLEITNVGNAKSRIDRVDIRSTDVYSPIKNRNYPTTIINESGLYDVILDSRKPQAKRFRYGSV